MNIPQIIHYEQNPRQITKSQFERLKETMQEFGDLSGIVLNLKRVKDGKKEKEVAELIGGNQRSEAGQFIGMQPVITEEFKKPLQDGTIAIGYFELKGKRFNCRIVRWDENKALRANLIANAGGGDWDIDTLANLDPALLLGIGFDKEKLDSIKNMSAAIGNIIASSATIDLTPPDDFPSFGEDIETEHQCPKCGYKWSGKSGVDNNDEEE